jgi:hypothetical protein
MTHTLAFRQSANPPQRRLTRPAFPRFFGRIARAFAAWQQSRRRFRAEAQLRRKLEGYSDHLLRDMGFELDAHRPLARDSEAAWTDRWTCDRNTWR